MRLNEQEITAALKNHGYKLTLPRRAVIRAITSSPDHLTPAEIFEKARKENPDMGLVTVYRTLEILGRLGAICEVHAGGNCRNYLARNNDEYHYHLLCSSCGLVVDLADYNLSNIKHELARKTGFQVESHLLEFQGRCPDCQNTTQAHPGSG